MYRYISKKSDGTLITYVFDTAREAYKHCVPEDKTDWHIMLLPEVLKRLEVKDLRAVLVSYDLISNVTTTTHYIQYLTDGSPTPLPHLEWPV